MIQSPIRLLQHLASCSLGDQAVLLGLLDGTLFCGDQFFSSNPYLWHDPRFILTIELGEFGVDLLQSGVEFHAKLLKRWLGLLRR